MATLEEMMMGLGGARSRYSGAPTPGGGGGLAEAFSGGAGLDPAIEAQIQALSQPEPVAPLAVPKKSQLWQRLASALADAGSTYATGMHAGHPTNFTGSQIEGDRYRDQAISDNAANSMKSKYNAKTKGAELRLQALLRKQEQEQHAKDKADDAEQNRLDRVRQSSEAVAKLAADANELQLRQDFDREQQENRFGHEEKMKKWELAARDDNPDDKKKKEADKVLEKFADGADIASNLLNGMPGDNKGNAPVLPIMDRLKGDRETGRKPESPDEIRAQFEDELTIGKIFGEARDMARNFFNERMIKVRRRLLDDTKQQQGM
jgi:hypothetical protein